MSWLSEWRERRRKRIYERKYRNPRYRQHSDGHFSGPYKGVVFGRGKPPTRPPAASGLNGEDGK